MYSGNTKQDLIRLARDRGLPTGGNKDELVARLAAHDAVCEQPTAGDAAPAPVADPEPDASEFEAAYRVNLHDRDSYDNHMKMVAQTVEAGRAAGVDARLPRRAGQYANPDGTWTVIYTATVRKNRRQ